MSHSLTGISAFYYNAYETFAFLVAYGFRSLVQLLELPCRMFLMEK